MSYAQDFPAGEAIYDQPAGLLVDLPPLALVALLLLLAAAGYAGWIFSRRRRPSPASAASAIWKAIDDAIRAALTAHSDGLRDKASSLTRVIEDRLGHTLRLTGGLTALESLEAALGDAATESERSKPADSHASEHHPEPAVTHDEAEDGNGSTVVIERARHVIIHAPERRHSGGHDKPKPPLTEAERRHAIRQAVSDLNDHWRLKEARIAEIEAAHRELTGPRR